MKSVKNNLELMMSKEKGGMYGLRESIGGNAGTWRGHGCWAANFYYDDYGEIHCFANPPATQEIESKYMEGTFRIAKRASDFRDRIVEIFVSKKERFARAVLIMTVEEFNEMYGFKVEDER